MSGNRNSGRYRIGVGQGRIERQERLERHAAEMRARSTTAKIRAAARARWQRVRAAAEAHPQLLDGVAWRQFPDSVQGSVQKSVETI